MDTITNKKQYPSEQYLNELITNMEFAARAPVEVVRAMAAELQKRRKADSAEPVAWRYRTTDINGNPNPRWSFSEEPSLLGLYQPLYADPQQPLSFPDAMEPTVEAIKRVLPTSNPDEYAVCIGADMWNACRAAMLHDAEPVSQTYELPELIEGMEVSVDVSTCDFDAGHRYFCTVTEVSELDSAKNGYILLVQDAKPNFDVNGNSPVIQDGWISCSERMPNEEDVLVYCSDTKEQMVGFHKGKGLFQFFYMNGVEGVCEPSHWMPLPEPPQEVNRG
ncbi:DUF551 domain-containing protein [Salmonella enterica subsp. enterica]|nr:DUF551 domain-containing protein [Salmonella enterica subsp. enterica serovar Mokola]HDA4097394.1 DUF551 domain-containing protein [Salmonella enterica subsp. enterica serovar Mokola]HDA4105719.1 DUF551 domain-containing protein [Salmonella enterica subsp. enterica serovar Mokola]HDA4156337.1 DUF551 domain-containing protein [Salmonella enterica subsp. enterica serovar Mokola]HDA4178231.1 DUF551 domain-containing protein [Salmonella enterica subsp. enterica serovar Mokola]